MGGSDAWVGRGEPRGSSVLALHDFISRVAPWISRGFGFCFNRPEQNETCPMLGQRTHSFRRRSVMFKRLDHVASVVADTEAALQIWRDRFGLPVLFTETINDGTVRLAHLDLGNTHLQLVEPLTTDHPLAAWLAAHRPCLCHLCLGVDDVSEASMALQAHDLAPGELQPHQGTQGKRALFLDHGRTENGQVELTGR